MCGGVGGGRGSSDEVCPFTIKKRSKMNASLKLFHEMQTWRARRIKNREVGE